MEQDDYIPISMPSKNFKTHTLVTNLTFLPQTVTFSTMDDYKKTVKCPYYEGHSLGHKVHGCDQFGTPTGHGLQNTF